MRRDLSSALVPRLPGPAVIAYGYCTVQLLVGFAGRSQTLEAAFGSPDSCRMVQLWAAW
jgi:hypothetical protein